MINRPGYDVFISYGREDIESARRLHGDLESAGLRPWLDVVDILGGEEWRPAVARAIRNSRYFVPLISSRTADRAGYVHHELRDALDILDEQPQSSIYLIPARLDDCEPDHDRLRSLNWVDLFPDWYAGLARLLRSIAPECNAPGSNDPQATYLDSLRSDLSLWRGLGLGRSVRLTDTYVSIDVSRNQRMPEADLLTAILDGQLPERTVVVQGPAGCGKTTLLRHWALDCADAEARAVPIFVPLASVEADGGGSWGTDLIELVANRYAPTNLAPGTGLETALESAASTGRLLVLLDGADEVTKEARPAFRHWIDRQRRRLGSCPVVITSRPVGVLNATTAQQYNIEPFNIDQQRQFIQNWFGSASDAPDRILAQVAVQVRLRAVVGNPLFLVMVCIDYEVSGHLPSSPALLLDRFVHILLDEWDRERGVTRTSSDAAFPTETRMAVLEAIAASSFESDRRRFTKRKAAAIASAIVGGEREAHDVLDEIESESGLLLSNRVGDCQFAHPLLQEFFVARHRAELTREGDDQGDWCAERFFDDRFGNVAQYYDELTDGATGRSAR